MVGQSDILLSKLAQFREQGEFIDVGLKVGEEVFSAHRIVLAASSDYFHAIFAHGMKESNQEVTELEHFSSCFEDRAGFHLQRRSSSQR